MVLDHVAEGAGRFIERAAAFDADRLGGGDLDVVDVVAIPDVFEDAVGEPEDEDVLHCLFAEIVVDAEDLVFGEDLVDLVGELARADSRSWPKGFSMMVRTQPVSSVRGLGHAVLAEDT